MKKIVIALGALGLMVGASITEASAGGSRVVIDQHGRGNAASAGQNGKGNFTRIWQKGKGNTHNSQQNGKGHRMIDRKSVV